MGRQKPQPPGTPTPFLWGVATSAYQAEGHYNGEGQPRTNWADAEERGDVMKLGDSADFLRHYREDFRRCRNMGLNGFRLGIEWSRIQPSYQPTQIPGHAAPPPFDAAAISLYADMIAAARSEGLEPVVTLHHFVHPAWLGKDPWLEESSPDLFCRYVRAAVLGVNRELVERHRTAPIRYYITINEPNMLVLNTYFGNQFPGGSHRGPKTIVKAYTQLLRAHLCAYDQIHSIHESEGWPTPMATLNNYCSDLYWSDKFLLDLLAARERGIPRIDVHDYICAKAAAFDTAFDEARIPLHKDLPFLFGRIVKWAARRIGRRDFQGEGFRLFLDELYAAPRERAFDYLGLDYYDPFLAHLFRLPVLFDHEFKNRSLKSWVLSTITSKWWDWRVLPRGLQFFCEYYSADFGDRPVLIAENGMAVRRRPDNRKTRRRDRMTRSDFLTLHVHQVQRIVRSGVPLFGYLHWSLFDNYEWGSFTPRFGIYGIDYTQGTERLPEDPFGDCASATYAELVERATQEMRTSQMGKDNANAN